MANLLLDKIADLQHSLQGFMPELILGAGVILMLVTGLFRRIPHTILHALALMVLMMTLVAIALVWPTQPQYLMLNMLRADSFARYLTILCTVGGLLTVCLTWRYALRERLSEYYALLFASVLGAHLLVMGVNLMMTFLALELLSISAYVLVIFTFEKKASEGALKYFLFGSAASALMLYGFSFLYGITGTLDFTSAQFTEALVRQTSPLWVVCGVFALGGFLYKLAAAPLHPWAPDAYEAAPMPVVAFFSVVPKVAGVGIFIKFILAINLYGQAPFDWQRLVAVVAILSITVGNFAALLQKNVKRLMAYSSIAQSGFLLVGVAAFLPQGVHSVLFYATVYLVTNFLVFLYLQSFEKQGLVLLADYAGLRARVLGASLGLLVGFVSLTGLPPTAGFTAKLLVFSSLWEAYQLSGKSIILGLMIWGLLNTVVALFYYLRIPYYALIKTGEPAIKTNILTFENLLGLILVFLLLLFFFSPGLLMGWINKINFVL